MIRQLVSDFPAIETAYTDEFGAVNPKVYAAAKEIWLPAERLACELLHDSHNGRQLMLKAVVKVSRVCETREIENLSAYVYRTYKNLVLAELEKENGHRRILSERYSARELTNEAEADLNRKILVNELRRRMDKWTRGVFDHLNLNYKFEELVPDYGTAANAIRSKYSKRLAKLARQIAGTVDEIDQQVKNKSV